MLYSESMKGSTISIIVGVVILFGGLVWYFFSDTPIKNYPSTSTGPVLMFGDSLVEGVGATTGQTLPDQLGRILQVPVLN